MPQPPTLKDHGIPLCMVASLKSVWHGKSYQHLRCCEHRFWVHWCMQACHLAKICIPKDRGTIMGVSFLVLNVLEQAWINGTFTFFLLFSMSLCPLGKKKKPVCLQTVWCCLPCTMWVNDVGTCNTHGGNKKAYTVLDRKHLGKKTILETLA